MDVEEYIDNDHEFRKLRFDKENKCFVYESSNEITELTEEPQHNYYEMVDKNEDEVICVKNIMEEENDYSNPNEVYETDSLVIGCYLNGFFNSGISLNSIMLNPEGVLGCEMFSKPRKVDPRYSSNSAWYYRNRTHTILTPVHKIQHKYYKKSLRRQLKSGRDSDITIEDSVSPVISSSAEEKLCKMKKKLAKDQQKRYRKIHEMNKMEELFDPYFDSYGYRDSYECNANVLPYPLCPRFPMGLVIYDIQFGIIPDVITQQYVNNAPFVTACCYNETSIHYNEEKYEDCEERFVLPTNLIIQTTSSPENFSISSGTEMEDMVQMMDCCIYAVAQGPVFISPDSSPSVPSTPKASDTIVKKTISPQPSAFSYVCSCVSSVLTGVVGAVLPINTGICSAYPTATIGESVENASSDSSANRYKSYIPISSLLSSIIDNVTVPLLSTGFALFAIIFHKGSN